VPHLADVRRYEAASFRAWPAAAVHYDGTWVVRLTAGHPAKRLNSVNPLDPGDVGNLRERIARAARRFDAYGRALTFRMSPLAGKELSDYLDGEGWDRLSDSLVLGLPIENSTVADAIDRIPLKDMSRFVSAAMKVQGFDHSLRAGLSEVIDAIEPEAGLFALERDHEVLTTAICVHDGNLAGLFELATDPAVRGQGHAKGLIRSALKWAKSRGAKEAWLQVEADNERAIGLYKAMGFSELYRYHYRRPPAA
jgi:ribosomal protein S18 acetylase RimI-like enzyme